MSPPADIAYSSLLAAFAKAVPVDAAAPIIPPEPPALKFKLFRVFSKGGPEFTSI